MKQPILKTLSLLTVVAMAACVPQKKYDALLAENEQMRAKLEACDEQLGAVSEDAARLENSLDQQVAQSNRLQADIQQREAKIRRLEAELARANGRYESALAGSDATKQALLREQEEVAQLKAELQDLQRIIAEKEAAIEAIRSKIRQALLAFKDDELTVELRDGKVYVSLAEKLLFGSGSTTVAAEGKTALQKLAEAIKDEQGLSLLVEGHTDNVPLSNTTRLKDNWDLSVMRGTAITRILVEAGVPPAMITAAGRGEHVPKASNATAAGKAQNRRSEIIIAPNLDELFQLGK